MNKDLQAKVMVYKADNQELIIKNIELKKEIQVLKECNAQIRQEME